MQIAIGIGVSRGTAGAGGGSSAPETPVTSYENTGGRYDRRSFITVTSSGCIGSNPADLVAGYNAGYGFSGGLNNDGWFNTATAVGAWVRFEFANPVCIQEATLYQSSATAQGTWKWQGSNDGSAWTDLGGTFVFNQATQVVTTLSANVTWYRYYRMLGTAGSTDGGPYFREAEFKVSKEAGIEALGTSYTNTLGSGNRTASVAVVSTILGAAGSQLVDGNQASEVWISNTAAGGTIRFDLGSAKIVTQARVYRNSAHEHWSEWKWQASNDGSAWTDMGGSFQLGGKGFVSYGAGFGANATAYRYYRLYHVSGTSSGGYCGEVEFRVSA